MSKLAGMQPVARKALRHTALFIKQRAGLSGTPPLLFIQNEHVSVDSIIMSV